MIKKILITVLLLPLLLIFAKCTSEKFRKYGVVKVGETELCIPKEYELTVNLPFLWFADGLDEDAAGGLYIIPAQELAASIEGYTLSHINQHNVNLAHDITGIIWADYQVTLPDGLAEKAWNLNTTEKQPHAIYNPTLDMYELGDKRFIDTWWHLAKTLPKGAPVERPEEWYFGYCFGEKPSNYQCGKEFYYKNLYFDYDIRSQDIPVAKEIRSFLINKFLQWESACES